MKIDVQRAGETVTLVCCGCITFGLEAETLEAMARTQNCRRLLLDLKCVGTVDAHGLGSLVGIHLWAKENGVKLALVNVAPAVRELVQLARLDTIIPMCVTAGSSRKHANSHHHPRLGVA